MTLTNGAFPGGKINAPRDADVPKRASDVTQGPALGASLSVSKVDGVFKSGNTTRDTIPSHLVVGKEVPAEVAAMYVNMCPAGVYELVDGRLRVNAPNCVDCKATDVLGPRWTPREGGSGPRYKRM
jgi:electron-transferring-flavoprotein dehydrogenase